MSRKTGLGRGLSALIPDNQQNEENQPDSRIQTDQQGTPDSNILEIATDDIKPNPNQPRTHFNEQDIEQLARSIKEHGILQPLLVSDKENGAYQLIAGERRWRAAKIANLEKVPVLVRETNPQEILELALIENIQRADLSALEEAAAYQKLANDFQLTQQEIAERVGIMDKGELLLVEEKKDLLRNMGSKTLTINLINKINSIPKTLSSFKLSLSSSGDILTYNYKSKIENAEITKLLTKLQSSGLSISDINTEQTSLEEIFVDIVRK